MLKCAMPIIFSLCMQFLDHCRAHFLLETRREISGSKLQLYHKIYKKTSSGVYFYQRNSCTCTFLCQATHCVRAVVTETRDTILHMLAS